jgi:hypothetical protein
MNRTSKKLRLSLNKETLRTLDPKSLDEAVGAATVSAVLTGCSGYISKCAAMCNSDATCPSKCPAPTCIAGDLSGKC